MAARSGVSSKACKTSSPERPSKATAASALAACASADAPGAQREALSKASARQIH
jgi:hypothetical protein